MGIPVVIKASGGLPVTLAANGRGVPMTVATNGFGMPVTQATRGLPVVGITFGAGGAYAGPGDAVPGAYAWHGLQAYTTASIGMDVVRLRESGGNTEQTFVSIAGGGLDLAAITTFKGANNLFVRKLFDQSGNNRHIEQTTNALQPQFLLNQINSLPAMKFTAASSQILVAASGATAWSFPAPFTVSSVVYFTGPGFLTIPGTSGPMFALDCNAANSLRIYVDTGTFSKGSVPNGVFYSVLWKLNGAASDIFVTGASTIGTAGDPGTIISPNIGGTGAFGFLDGFVVEFGYYTSALSGANMTAMYTNQNTRYAV